MEINATNHPPAEAQEAALPPESRGTITETAEKGNKASQEKADKFSRLQSKVADRRTPDGEKQETKEGEKPAKAAKKGEDDERVAGIAKHEAKVRAEQKAFESTVAEFSKQREEVEAVANRAQQIVDGMQIAVADPVKFYEDVLGLKEPGDMAEVAKLLYYKAAGLKPPTDVQAKTGVNAMQRHIEMLNRRMEDMAQKLEQREASRGEEDVARAYRDDTSDFVHGLTQGMEGLEYLSAEAEADPDAVGRALLNEAATMMEEESLDEAPDPSDVAQRIEKTLRAHYEKRQGRYSKLWGLKNGSKEEDDGAGKRRMKASPAVSERDLSTPNERRGPPKDAKERMARALDRIRENVAARRANQ